MQVAEIYTKGLEYLKKQKNDQALAIFTQVLSYAPKHFNTKFYIATIFLLENKLDIAAEKFLELLEAKPEDPEILTNLGVIALRQEKPQKAVDYFVKALCFDNNHLEARHNLAATFIHNDRFENALVHYQILLENDKNNPEYLYNLGVIYMHLAKLEDAIYYFNKISQEDAQYKASLQNLAIIYSNQQNDALVIKTLEKIKNIDADDAYSDFIMQAYNNAHNPKYLPEYVKNLFDRYALYYEKHMVQTLKYNLPQHIESAINKHFLIENMILDKGLDLGCGTGLCAYILQKFCKHTVGVDLSLDMLNFSKKHQRYDNYYHSNILDFLDNNQEIYDLIILADVLPYFGEVDTLFKKMHSRLSSKGYIVLSHEISLQNKPWCLEKTTRFSHNPDYINSCCAKNNFKIIYTEKVIARMQNNLAVHEELYIICNQNYAKLNIF